MKLAPALLGVLLCAGCAEDGRELSDDEPEARLAARLPAFDQDGARLLDRGLPLGRLVEAVETAALPPGLAQKLAVAGFVRAVVLDDAADAATRRRAADLAGRLEPALAADSYRYLQARSPEQQRFRGQLAILRFPGLRPYVTAGVARATPLFEIDDYRDNWWCSDAGLAGLPNFDRELDSFSDPPDGGPPAAPSPPPPDDGAAGVLSSGETAQLAREVSRLAGVGAAPDYLGSQVLAYAHAHPEDLDLPEALHLVVRATRYGCTTQGSSALSHAAFRLLHKRYPYSIWTERTPFWF